ncbi:MAG: sugar ABC transporter ATP-binding protein [Opitutaceae bacterium]|nr:sugar ABC transporter ATP-binding protein [Opitutaceae bacterium]
MTPSPAVEFKGIVKRFHGVPVLKGVSFAVPAGHTTGLVGENGAGKSTLMNILGGNLRSDAGTMQIGGHSYFPTDPTHAARARIAFIHQELNLFSNLSVAENIFLADLPCRRGLPLVDRRTLRLRTTALLDRVGLAVSPDALVETLSAGERQLVEIARAFSIDARLIIFDEPTTSLSARETETLFGLVRSLRRQGIAMIYISHILEHIRDLCDDLVVLRDGEVTASGSTAQFSTDQIVTAMVGRKLGQLFPSRRCLPTPVPALVARNVSQPCVVNNVSFTLNRGEVLGIFGLMGAGRSELARILFGLDPHASGEVSLDGTSIVGLEPRRRIERGLAFLTEDRRQEGICLEASIADNIALVFCC